MNIEDNFTVWLPNAASIIKSEGEDTRRIGGYCSTQHLDRQDEIVLQKGLDFTEFADYGFFNDNHNQATAAVVGIPDKVEFHAGKGWYTTGELLKGFSRADEIWSLAKSLENTKRRLGFSIEGKVIERDGNRIVKAKIRNVAITNAPVNPNCSWSTLSKSFTNKALTVSHGRAPTSGGGVLTQEDLEHDEVKQVWECGSCGKAFRSKAGHADHMSKTHKKNNPSVTGMRKARELEVEKAVGLLRRLRPHYSVEACKRIVGFAQKG